eukprot:scaffold88540_cov61-Phaeocystis_antarctica.AAC.2
MKTSLASEHVLRGKTKRGHETCLPRRSLTLDRSWHLIDRTTLSHNVHATIEGRQPTDTSNRRIDMSRIGRGWR